MTAIVVYGSLINMLQLEEQSPMFLEAAAVSVAGYRRVFNQEPSWRKGHGERRAALNVMESGDGCFNGVLVRLRHDCDFDELDERERGYERVALDPSRLAGFSSVSRSILSESIYIYTGKPEKRNDDLLPNSEYLELCVRGAKQWGKEFHARFLQTTYVGQLTLRSFLKHGYRTPLLP